MIESRQRMLWGAMAVSCMLHFSVLWSWRNHAIGTSLEPSHAAVELRLIRPRSVSSVTQSATPKKSAVPQISRSTNRPADPIPQIEASVPLPVLPGTPQPDHRATANMLETARSAAGKLDRELRQSLPPHPGIAQPPAKSSFAALEKNIAAAGVSRGTTMQEMILPDGQHMTKVTTPGGTYCVLGRRPDGRGARDAANEPGFVTISCPQ